MKYLIFILILISSTFAKSKYCYMQTMYRGFNGHGDLFKQEAIYNLSITKKPKIWQFQYKKISNLTKEKTVEEFYKEDPTKTESVFLLSKDADKGIIKKARYLFDKVSSVKSGNIIKYPCPYWIKALYDQQN